MAENMQVAEAFEDGCFVALTMDYLDSQNIINRVRSPEAGAIVLFIGMKPSFSFHPLKARVCVFSSA